MNKQKFNSLVSKPQSLSKADIAALTSVAKNHPYSQIVHSLLAKAHENSKTEDSTSAINRAAMYAGDRQVLKELIMLKEQPVKEVSKKVKVTEQKPQEADESDQSTPKITKPKHKKITIDTSSITADSKHLRNELWSDLEQLKSSKANYLESLEKSKDTSSKKVTPSKKAVKVATTPTATKKTSSLKKTSSATKTSAKPKAKPAAAKKTVAPKKVTKSTKSTSTAKKATPKPVAKKSTSTAKTTKSSVKKSVSKSSGSTKASSTTPKVKSTESKAATKVSKKPSGTKSKTTQSKKTSTTKTIVKKKPEVKHKVKEQQKIIDTFIDKEPSISSKPVLKVDVEQKDLSIKSTSLGEDLISENLAMILIDQGKTQQALDMYKKLIWKFPQKKSYFAARMEDLTK